MKRSEAAARIRSALNYVIIRDDWEYQLLEVVEDIGMIPPIEPGRTVYDLDLGIPEWEPETTELDKDMDKALRNREHR